MPPCIEIDGLVVRHGDLTAVDQLSLAIEEGQVLALLGPNGAGKTTTVETLEGYRRPDEGRVAVLGLDPVGEHASLVPKIGVMLQQGGVYPTMSPIQALRLFAAYYDDALFPDELLGRLGLDDVAATPWRRLSGGEQQRLSLALALVGRPRVLFLDEPTAGVDLHGRVAIREVIAEQAAAGVTVLLTTHELAEAEAVADRVAIIHRGRLAREGSIAELTGGGLRFSSAPGLDAADLSRALGAAAVEAESGTYVVEAEASGELIARLGAWLDASGAALEDLRSGASLEDAYRAVVGEAALEQVAIDRGGPRRERSRGRSRR